jgi:chromosomal replication initiator protein
MPETPPSPVLEAGPKPPLAPSATNFSEIQKPAITKPTDAAFAPPPVKEEAKATMPAPPSAPLVETVKKPAAPPAALVATNAAAPQVPARSAESEHNDKTILVSHSLHIDSGKIYKKDNWPVEMPLIPTFTFENMDMSSNRFLHATAMSIAGNLGALKNPLFIYGGSGAGKTHFLNAIGYVISQKIGQGKIFFTSGVRLSRGIQRHIEEGTLEALEGFFHDSSVIIIDDIHLTAVNEKNRQAISKVLNSFLNEKKQIILSSRYQPESLARFEELVSFKFNQGFVFEIKALPLAAMVRIYNKVADDLEFNIQNIPIESFFGDSTPNLGLISRNMRRARVLHRKMSDVYSAERSYQDIIKEMLPVNGESSGSEIMTKNMEEVSQLRASQDKTWGSFGFFFPQDNTDKFAWIGYALAQKAKELGIKGGFDYALKSSYLTLNIISSAFKIANICDNKNLKGAVILGPSLTQSPAVIRDNFYDIIRHMLEVMNMRCGIINPEHLKYPSEFMKILGDVLR